MSTKNIKHDKIISEHIQDSFLSLEGQKNG